MALVPKPARKRVLERAAEDHEDKAKTQREEAAKLQMFLQSKLNPELVVQCRNRPDECAEIHIGDECLGVVSKIIDEGETSYSFEITILDIDLEEV